MEELLKYDLVKFSYLSYETRLRRLEGHNRGVQDTFSFFCRDFLVSHDFALPVKICR